MKFGADHLDHQLRAPKCGNLVYLKFCIVWENYFGNVKVHMVICGDSCTLDLIIHNYFGMLADPELLVFAVVSTPKPSNTYVYAWLHDTCTQKI